MNPSTVVVIGGSAQMGAGIAQRFLTPGRPSRSWKLSPGRRPRERIAQGSRARPRVAS